MGAQWSDERHDPATDAMLGQFMDQVALHGTRDVDATVVVAGYKSDPRESDFIVAFVDRQGHDHYYVLDLENIEQLGRQAVDAAEQVRKRIAGMN